MTGVQTCALPICFPVTISVSIGVGLAFGNLVVGIPLDANADFRGSFSTFFRPFPVLVGIFTVSLMTMHGAIFLAMKTEGVLHNKLRVWAKRAMGIFIFFYVVTTLFAWILVPHLMDRFKEEPWLFVIPFLALLSILNIPRLFSKNRDGWAFLSSCFCIFLLFCVFGIGTFPYLVRSTIDPELHSLTFFNSAASFLTLKALSIIVLIGVPLVLGYGVYIYRIFRGKVKLDNASY